MLLLKGQTIFVSSSKRSGCTIDYWGRAPVGACIPLTRLSGCISKLSEELSTSSLYLQNLKGLLSKERKMWLKTNFLRFVLFIRFLSLLEAWRKYCLVNNFLSKTVFFSLDRVWPGLMHSFLPHFDRHTKQLECPHIHSSWFFLFTQVFQLFSRTWPSRL